jgi:hypothetical protein
VAGLAETNVVVARGKRGTKRRATMVRWVGVEQVYQAVDGVVGSKLH